MADTTRREVIIVSDKNKGPKTKKHLAWGLFDGDMLMAVAMNRTEARTSREEGEVIKRVEVVVVR